MQALAIDLGTTNISLALSCAATGGAATGSAATGGAATGGAATGVPATRLGTLVRPNPQTRWGADVISRLQAACASPSAAAELQRAAVEAIGRAVADVCAGAGRAAPDVTAVAVVGNTVMLALLTGHGYAELLDPANWMSFVACDPVPWGSLRRSWGVAADAGVDVVPSLAGFVGSDLLAGVTRTRLRESAGPALLIDFGTNSELALWDGQRVRVTSAAGGPAFEGVGIECGMPALPGAVSRVRPDPVTGWRLETLGGGEPQGICGCGLVDVVALLRRDGRLSANGRLEGVPGGRVRLPGSPLSVTARDVDVLMRAKAAIGAGCEVLCRQAGVHVQDLVTVEVAGAMGADLEPRHAVDLGLIPPVDPGRVRVRGNTALTGCEEYLFSERARASVREVRERALVTNLADAEGFEEAFFAHLYLRPQRSWSPRP